MKGTCKEQGKAPDPLISAASESLCPKVGGGPGTSSRAPYAAPPMQCALSSTSFGHPQVAYSLAESRQKAILDLLATWQSSERQTVYTVCCAHCAHRCLCSRSGRLGSFTLPGTCRSACRASFVQAPASVETHPREPRTVSSAARVAPASGTGHSNKDSAVSPTNQPSPAPTALQRKSCLNRTCLASGSVRL